MQSRMQTKIQIKNVPKVQIVQKSKSHLNTNQNVVNRMAEKNFEIYQFWLGLNRLQAAQNVTSSVNAAHRDGAIPVIIGNGRLSSMTSSGPGSCCRTREEIPAHQRKHERIITPVHRSTGSHECDNTVPSLYVLNAAALTKPHAIEQLTAELTGYNIDVAIISETHLILSGAIRLFLGMLIQILMIV